VIKLAVLSNASSIEYPTALSVPERIELAAAPSPASWGTGAARAPVAKARIAEATTVLKYILTFERVDNLCWYQRTRCKKACKLREVVSLAAVKVFVVDCADVVLVMFCFSRLERWFI
jgi:hypothetical protein